MQSYIVAIEGASGSGKSTLVQALAERNPDYIIPPQWKFERDRTQEVEVWGNSVMDYQTIMAAVIYSDTVILADRFLLGHWVYQEYKMLGDSSWVENCIFSYNTLVDTAITEHIIRCNSKFDEVKPKTLIINLECTENELQYNRTKSGKLYPFNERVIYADMAKQLVTVRDFTLVRMPFVWASVDYIQSMINGWIRQ